ncbi:MAG: dephospho-CoA kinase [Gammaproteobacteria bacterium]|nr:dephospho-CoA kinase [Gammaproteobacteria bacterium]
MPYTTKLVVGLTGGIGSGKSTVAELFAKLGTPIIDTDKFARELTQPNQEAFKAIEKHYAHQNIIHEGHLNRAALRKIIFDNEKERKWLEDLLHPLIRLEIERQVKQVTFPYCMVAIPLLFESQPNPLIQRTLVVDAPEELQITRTQSRDLTSTQDVEAIMKTQVTRAHRLENADDIIVNDGSLEKLEQQVKVLHEFYLKLGG